MAVANELGSRGERWACKYLLEKGYQILEKNWRFGNLEIDIIARKENVLVAVEVKTRSHNYFMEPEQAVNQSKIDNILQAVNQYVAEKDLDTEIRLDIIALTKKRNAFELKHLKNAFYYF